jgi:hypothetical protein
LSDLSSLMPTMKTAEVRDRRMVGNRQSSIAPESPA